MKYRISFFRTTGILCMFKTPEEEQAYQSCLKNMQTYSPEHLDLSETKSDLFNRVLNYSEKPHALLYDKSGGVLFAHKCVLTIQDLFIAKGGHLWHNCEVMDIVPEGNHIEINTSEQRLLVPSVIVCVGAWTKKLLVPNLMPDLPLKPILVKAYYWKEKEGGVHSSKAGFPVVIDIGGDADIYTIPSIEYPGLAKVCYHGGPMCDPDKRDQSASYVEYEQILKDHVTKHLPLLEAEPAIVETCMYTLTPDEVFLLDRVPGHKNIIIGSGFSGTGFKTSPAVARLLSEMATGQQTFLDLAPFRLSRFDDN
nr:peroxisomal sarcosine oxidase [Parasteatoda tepidariorum]